MGSLMSGWSSRFQDPSKVKSMRNKSLTRAEIDAYWNSKKKTEEDHFKSISPPSSLPPTPSTCTTCGDNDDDEVDDHHVFFRRSASMPMEPTSSEELLEPLFKKTSCWWTTSKWAFLNEPPVLISEATEKQRLYNYTPNNFHRHESAAGGLISSSPKPDIRVVI